MASRYDIAGGEEEELKKSDAIASAAEKFRQKSKPWYTKAGEAISGVASSIGGAISSGAEALGEAGGGVGSRLGPIPGSEKEKETKEKQEASSEERQQQRIDDILSQAKEAASEAGTSLEEDADLQSAVRSELEKAVGKEKASQVEMAPPAKAEPASVVEAPKEETEEEYTPPSDEEDEQVTSTLEMFKQVPNPIDVARERNLVKEEFLNELASAKEAYNQTKDEVARKKLWDSIITGLANIAAGLYGIQTGLDLSGVKFDVSDWSDDLQQAQSDLSAARTFAKDVKDVKLSELDERRDDRLREIQSIRQLNSDAIDRIELARRNRKEENYKIQSMLEASAEKNLGVENKLANNELYKSYKDDQKRIEQMFNKLPGMKSSDRKETVEMMRYISNQMQGKVDRINQSLPAGEEFNNQYPPKLFAPTKGFFGGDKDPDLSDLVERGIKLSSSPAQGDYKAQALGMAKNAGMEEKDLRVYENYLNNPQDYNQEKIKEILKRYNLLKED